MTLFDLTVGEGPLLAAAIHNGHNLRDDVAEIIALGAAERLREEDPFTGELAALAPSHLVGQRSRFEIDLNRPREKAVYRRSEDAWGLSVWRTPPSVALVEDSLANYDLFFAIVRLLLKDVVLRYGRAVVLDLHTYNHCRKGRGCVANPDGNPDINIGTESIEPSIWRPVVDRLIADLKTSDYMGREYDVRENVKFSGGHFPRWIHATFPGQVCAIAIEFKKTFMDEWTGELDRQRFDALKTALRGAISGVLATLGSTDDGK